MRISITIEGEPQELAEGCEKIGSALKIAFGDTVDVVGLDTHDNHEIDLALMRKVWNRITEKAKLAIRTMLACREGVTKEDIVLLSKNRISDTRDLGGALSSIARVAKALKITNYQSAIYNKYETEDGQILYVLTEAAREQLTQITG